MLYKKILLALFLATCTLAGHTQVVRIDSVAILILDRMSAVIGDLNACSFTLDVSQDVPDNTFFNPVDGIGLIKQFDTHEVYMSGPDKMLINSRGDRGHRGYWYNGKQFAYYSYKENNYAIVPAPDNILDAIDAVNLRYGVDFPAADFFYPSFVDDLLDHCTHLLFLGVTQMNGKPCFQLVAAAEDLSAQFWISNDGLALPLKMVLTYRDMEERPQYEATFSNWALNPDLPPALFEFMPPPQAREIVLVARPEE